MMVSNNLSFKKNTWNVHIVEKMQCGVIIAWFMARIFENLINVIIAKIVMLMFDAIRTQGKHFELLQTENWGNWGWRHTKYLILCGKIRKWQEKMHTRCFQIIFDMRSTLGNQMSNNAKQSLSFYNLTFNTWHLIQYHLRI